MRIRSWLAALFTAIASLFGFGPRNSTVARDTTDHAAIHQARLRNAHREWRGYNRSNYAVVPPFHKVKGKTRAVLRSSV